MRNALQAWMTQTVSVIFFNISVLECVQFHTCTMTQPYIVMPALKSSTTTRTYLFHRHTTFPSFLKLIFFRTAFLIPRVKTAFDEWQVFWLTPYPEAFPMFQIRHQWQKMFPRYINGASQQRDCLGLTPNSLLIRMTRIFIRNQFGTKIKKKTERGRIINKKCKIQSHSASSIIDILTFCHLVFSMWLVAHFSESTPGFSGKSAVFTILQEQKNIREHIF